MMFVDACAIVALLSLEDTAPAYGAEIDRANERWTSVPAAFEAVLVLGRPDKLGLAYLDVANLVLTYLDEREIAIRETGAPREALIQAASAAQTFGVGRKKLSTLDCIHYAYAKTTRSSLLTLDTLLRDTDVTTVP